VALTVVSNAGNPGDEIGDVALDECRVGPARVDLQVNPDRVHAGIEHAKRSLKNLRR
jgi:hypothetical protein